MNYVPAKAAISGSSGGLVFASLLTAFIASFQEMEFPGIAYKDRGE